MSIVGKAIVEFSKDYFKNQDVPLHRPIFNGNEKKYLNECVESNFVSSVGKWVDTFESKFAKYVKSKYAISTVNGTSALHLSLHSLGIGKGDEVITQALTFVATCNAIIYTGASPIFIDVDLDTLGMSYKSLEKFLKKNVEIVDNQPINIKTGKIIKACLPMHTFGFSCRIGEIVKLCMKYKINIIEDAAEGLGSYFNQKHLGTYGKIGTFSFNGNKIITTGGGGMVVTDNFRLAKRLKHLSTTAKVSHKYEYFHDELGFNYRLPSINAALGVAQLEQLPIFLKSKEELHKKWKLLFLDLDIQILEPLENSKSNYWLNTILVESKKERDKILEYTNRNGIMTRPAWTLMKDLPTFRKFEDHGLKNSRWLLDRCINIPSSAIN